MLLIAVEARTRSKQGQDITGCYEDVRSLITKAKDSVNCK